MPKLHRNLSATLHYRIFILSNVQLNKAFAQVFRVRRSRHRFEVGSSARLRQGSEAPDV